MNDVLAMLIGAAPTIPEWILPPAPKEVALPDWLLPPKEVALPDWLLPVPAPNMIQEYIDFGWKVIPLKHASKKPLVAQWNEQGAALKSSSDDNRYGVALQHAFSNTCSLDIDDLELARVMLAEQGIDVDELLNDPGNVQVVSGVTNKAKILFSLDSPMLSQVITRSMNGVNRTIFELRSAVSGEKTQVDALPPSIHPSTLESYRWKGNWKTLSQIPEKLLTYWHSLIETKAVRYTIPVFRSHPTSEQEITNALTFISPDCGRKQWIDIGMAIHNADLPFSVWDNWSKQSEKYNHNEMATQWHSFEHDGGITLGTLFSHARDGGYVRPKPDVTELFKDMTPTVEYDEMSNLMRPAPPDIDTMLFPKTLRYRAEEISTERGCDVIVPLFAGLSAMSSALDARSRLHVGNEYAVPPILWIMTLGSPGDKKTPGSTPMFDVVRTIEKEQLKFYSHDLLKHEALELVYNDKKKRYLAHMNTEAGMFGEAPPDVPDEPIKPSPLRMILSDVTSQKMCHTLCTQPRGTTALYDELGSLIRKLNDPRSGDDRGAWIQAYEGGTYALDRVGTGYMVSENFAATIYGNLQPRVLDSEISKMSNDGLLQRFIAGVIRPERTTLTQRVPPSTFKADYETALRSAFAVGKMDYYLDNEAKHHFRQFQIWFEKRRQDNRTLKVNDVFMTAFSKLESTVARVALIFHAYESPNDETVTGETMEKAIAFIKSYVIPSMRYCYCSSLGDHEQYILDIFTSLIGFQETVSLSELKRTGSNKFKDYKPDDTIRIINDTMQILENKEWVVNVVDTRQSKIWAINPALVESCKDNRKRILIARQRALEDTKEAIREAHNAEKFPRVLIKGYSTEWDSEL